MIYVAEKGECYFRTSFLWRRRWLVDHRLWKARRTLFFSCSRWTESQLVQNEAAQRKGCGYCMNKNVSIFADLSHRRRPGTDSSASNGMFTRRARSDGQETSKGRRTSFGRTPPSNYTNTQPPPESFCSRTSFPLKSVTAWRHWIAHRIVASSSISTNPST